MFSRTDLTEADNKNVARGSSRNISRLSTERGESNENRYLWPGSPGRSRRRLCDRSHRGFARYLQERGDRNPNEQAAERLPADLKSLIEGGAVALENAQPVIDHFAGIDATMVASYRN